MNLTVIGSTGRTGRLVLTEAIRRGHQVRAFTRRPDALNGQTGLAGVIHGDGRDRHAVEEAIKDADAVIAIVAAATRNGPHHSAGVARVLTHAMAGLRVPRLVITSAYPIVAGKPRLAIAALWKVLAAAYADAQEMEQVVTPSETGWTIARLNRLTDGPARGGTRITSGLLDKPTALTRADAAAALTGIAENNTMARAALNVAGPR